MFTLFTGHHIGGPRKSSNMAAPLLSSKILHRTFQWISQLWDNAQSLNLENCLLYISSIISQISDCMVFDFIFYCMTMHTLCTEVLINDHKWNILIGAAWHSSYPRKGSGTPGYFQTPYVTVTIGTVRADSGFIKTQYFIDQLKGWVE